MDIRNTDFKGRKGWELDNGCLKLIILHGGGHLASLRKNGKNSVNPYWEPPWKTIEPWQYKSAEKGIYGSKLLASICGHNLCLGWFGDPSESEMRAGQQCHGEAPVVRWYEKGRRITKSAVSLSYGCKMPVAGLSLRREIYAKTGANIITVKEEVVNRSRHDIPFTMCEHVTLGPPFVENGITIFDISGTKGHSFPGKFSCKQRFLQNRAFRWPYGPGVGGRKIDLRRLNSRKQMNSDFTVQLMDQNRQNSWFTAVNPRMGLLIAYIWRRSDFPWLGNWEENFARTEPPWSGRTLTRGMEFSNTPFPIGLRRASDLGVFDGLPTVRWVPARGKASLEYSIMMMDVPRGIRGIKDIRIENNEVKVSLIRK